ncbi:accumulation of dyads protein 2-related [Anaeramoeba flamelloides]|uniref:Accumulation of dyads protein 2-related n=1 Tax=Anaeramoeba flamelloides TaxID=1746091 RepID=A0AAV7YJ65_9EUKA|nr:accumulation of dyads protein 2-related [Anaeramoeba flamelloides]|eukprot:Anaeramoba_flamelloidesa1054512_251.p1 GENE.a1054512_251~~a1054512_251.p1  ORF type:complete len:267 (+),score=43.63 a1054512_251:51-803(+)
MSTSSSSSSSVSPSSREADELEDQKNGNKYLTDIISASSLEFPELLKVRIQSKPETLANPSSIGIVSLSIASLMLSFSHLEVTSDYYSHQIPWLLFLCGIGMLITGCVEAFKNNTFGMVVNIMYCTFFLSLGFQMYFEGISPADALDGALPHAGCAVLGYAIFNLTPLIIAGSLNKVLGLLFFAIEFFLFFLFLEFIEVIDHKKISGVFLFLVSVIGFYYCFADLMNWVAGVEFIKLGKGFWDLKKWIKK